MYDDSCLHYDKIVNASAWIAAFIGMTTNRQTSRHTIHCRISLDCIRNFMHIHSVRLHNCNFLFCLTLTMIPHRCIFVALLFSFHAVHNVGCQQYIVANLVDFSLRTILCNTSAKKVQKRKGAAIIDAVF